MCCLLRRYVEGFEFAAKQINRCRRYLFRSAQISWRTSRLFGNIFWNTFLKVWLLCIWKVSSIGVGNGMEMDSPKSYSAGNFPKSGKWTFWAMSPPKTGQEKNPGRPRPKIRLQNQGLQKCWCGSIKRGIWGGNIEGALKTVNLEKIKSRKCLGRIFLKLHIYFLPYNIVALLTPARFCEAISSLEEKGSSQT